MIDNLSRRVPYLCVTRLQSPDLELLLALMMRFLNPPLRIIQCADIRDGGADRFRYLFHVLEHHPGRWRNAEPFPNWQN